MHYIHWLVAQSMLAQGKRYATRYKGSGLQWRRAYGKSNPRGASELASVWFTAYPPSIITRPGETVLKTLADPALWEAFDALGVHGMHTGPMKRAGGVQG
ncbi:MAG: maltose alpha-D-glucosyltransferase, partial [Caldilineae bacterium]